MCRWIKELRAGFVNNRKNYPLKTPTKAQAPRPKKYFKTTETIQSIKISTNAQCLMPNAFQ
jgi:hypothetical protein